MRHTQNSCKIPFSKSGESLQNAASSLAVNMDEQLSTAQHWLCMYTCVCVCSMHIYISFFCTHKQFKTRIYAYLLFYERSSTYRMDACKMTSVRGTQKALLQRNKESRQESRQLLNLYVYGIKACEIQQKKKETHSSLQWVWVLVTSRIRNKVIAMHRS